MSTIFHKLGALIKRHERASLILVLGIAGFFLLFNALSRPIEYYGPDGEAYENMGYDAARAPSIFACNNFGRSYWSPGWIATIATIYKVAGRDPIAIRVFLVMIALVTALISYVVTRGIAGRGAALLAVILFLFSALVLRFTAYYQYEVPLAFFVALFGFLLFHRRESGSSSHPGWVPPLRIVAAGMVLGVAALFSPRVLIFIPLVLACWVLGRNVRRTVYGGLLIAVGLLLVLTPWTVRNHRCFGDLIATTTNGGINLYIGNNPHSTGSYYLPPKEARPDYAFYESKLWRKEALGYITAHPLQTVWRSFGKAYQLWKPHYGDQVIVLIAYIIGLIRLLRARRRLVASPGLMWVLFVPLVMTIVHMLFFAQIRYLIPLLPFVCAVAGAGIAGWHTDRMASNDKQIAVE